MTPPLLLYTSKLDDVFSTRVLACVLRSRQHGFARLKLTNVHVYRHRARTGSLLSANKGKTQVCRLACKRRVVKKERQITKGERDRRTWKGE